MQAVFKVKLPPSTGSPQDKPFVPRREHRKSRGGCLACKKRRIKCDEARPRCTRCLKIGADCMYEPSKSSARRTLFKDERDPVEDEMAMVRSCNEQHQSRAQQSPTPDMYSMAVDLLNSDLNLLLADDGTMAARPTATSNVRILQHFQATTFLTLGGPRYTKVFKSSVEGKAWELPYLMHMTLAVSCAHLKRLASQSNTCSLHNRYALAEATHWQSGLQLYQKALNGKQHDFDGTITATFLSIIFTFALDDEIPQDSYAANDPDKLMHAVNPLAATGGFGAIRNVLGERMLDSVWRAVLLDSDDDKGTFSSDTPGIAGLPRAFVELCGLDENSNSDSNPYHTIVRLLTPLLHLKQDGNNFTKLISFSGRTWRYFKPLLLRRDPRALLLISYWFTLMRQVDQWWIATRAKTECLALVRYLCLVDNEKITALLPFPASLGKADLSYIW